MNLLSIPVESTEVVNHDGFNRQLLQLPDSPGKADNLFFVLPQLWFEPLAKDSVMSINKIKADGSYVYAVTLIFDNIPDDDSVSGYRYDIKLRKNLHGIWLITEAKKSWCCWQGRGHSYFSVAPCP